MKTPFKKKKKGDSEDDFDIKTLSDKELDVVIRTAEATLYEGKAKTVTAMNDYGSFDILPRHIDYISTIDEAITVITLDNEKKDFPLDSGILRVYHNTVDVYIGIAAVKPEIDLEAEAKEHQNNEEVKK